MHPLTPSRPRMRILTGSLCLSHSTNPVIRLNAMRTGPDLAPANPLLPPPPSAGSADDGKPGSRHQDRPRDEHIKGVIRRALPPWAGMFSGGCLPGLVPGPPPQAVPGGFCACPWDPLEAVPAGGRGPPLPIARYVAWELGTAALDRVDSCCLDRWWPCTFHRTRSSRDSALRHTGPPSPPRTTLPTRPMIDTRARPRTPY